MRSVVKLNGARGVALLVGAVYCLARALAYLPLAQPPAELPAGLSLISTRVPIGVWAATWGLVGLFCIVMAFHRNDYLAWGLVVGMMSAWAVGYFLGWINSLAVPGDISREWLTATTYGGPAIMLGLLSSRLVEPLRKDRPDGSS